MSKVVSVEEKILVILAQENRRTFYQLLRKDKVASDKTILKALTSLEKEGLVRFVQEKKGRKRSFTN